jgi:hypothetical protein
MVKYQQKLNYYVPAVCVILVNDVSMMNVFAIAMSALTNKQHHKQALIYQNQHFVHQIYVVLGNVSLMLQHIMQIANVHFQHMANDVIKVCSNNVEHINKCAATGVRSRVYFNGDAWAELKPGVMPHESSERMETIEFDFKTEVEDGLILWQEQRQDIASNDKDYIAVFLRSGKLIFKYNHQIIIHIIV